QSVGQQSLGLESLRLGTGHVGRGAVVLGHPSGKATVAVVPATITDEVEVEGRDLYNRRSTLRDVYVLRAGIVPGDSGGPVVDSGGAVVGIAFALSPDQKGTAYALTTSGLRSMITSFGSDASSRAPVSTQRCLPK
ncbi:MAG: S1 family peptidase, partial [Acidimicrobiales bacterium]